MKVKIRLTNGGFRTVNFVCARHKLIDAILEYMRLHPEVLRIEEPAELSKIYHR